MKKIPYARQSINSDDIIAVSEALKSDLITRGCQVEAFEKACSEYCGSLYAVAFNNGTAALMAAYHAAGLSAYDRLITTPNTFIATVGAAVHCQTTPLYVDIDRSTGNFALEQVQINLEEHYSSRGRLIVAPVHFAGIAVDMAKLDRMICQQGTIVIEDAAHAFGSLYPDGQKVGSCAWSHMTIFSFHPNKNITMGEGGVVTTNDKELAYKLTLYRNNGIERDPFYLEKPPGPWYYEVKEITGNYNVTEMQAALGLSQLKRIDKFIGKRRDLITHYRERFQNIPHIKLFSSESDWRTAPHLFVLQIDFAAYQTTRREVMMQLKDWGIGTQVHYIPLYKHPCFSKGREDISAYFPEMEAYYAQALSLPLYYDLAMEEVDYVCDCLLKTLVHHGVLGKG